VSDLFLNKIAEKKKELQDTLAEQTEKLDDIKAFSKLAKKHGVKTDDLDELIEIANAVLGAAKPKT